MPIKSSYRSGGAADALPSRKQERDVGTIDQQSLRYTNAYDGIVEKYGQANKPEMHNRLFRI
jgi:hypothetical protein